MHRNEVIVRPISDHPTYYQDDQPGLRPSSYLVREQRQPPTMEGSPLRHGLQDMLVPSIETPSSDVRVVSPHSDKPRNIYGGLGRAPEAYLQRVVEPRRLSPASHQVIVIEDDSPQYKRRRVVREDNPVHFKPLLSRDQSQSVTTIPPEAHSVRASSPHSRDFLVRHPGASSTSNQGLLMGMQPLGTRPAGVEPTPGYATQRLGNISQRPNYLRVSELSLNSEQRGEPYRERQLAYQQPIFDGSRENFPPRRLVDENRRVIQQDCVPRVAEKIELDSRPVGHMQPPASPNFHVFSRIPRSHERNTGPVVADQTFIDTFSHSRLEPFLSQARDSSNVLPSARSHQSFVSQANDPRPHEDHPARSFTILRQASTRSPVQYLERPM